MNTAAHPFTFIMKSRKPEPVVNVRLHFALIAFGLLSALTQAFCTEIHAQQCPDPKAHSALHEINIRNQLQASFETQNIGPPFKSLKSVTISR